MIGTRVTSISSSSLLRGYSIICAVVRPDKARVTVVALETETNL